MIDAPLPRLPERERVVHWSRDLINDLARRLRALTQVKVSNTDSTYGFLSSKIAAGARITLTILNPGANEQLQIAVTGAAGGVVEIPSGARPGTTFLFAATPALIQPYLNGVALWSQATPGVGEYSMSTNQMTTGDTVVAGDRLWALVWY